MAEFTQQLRDSMVSHIRGLDIYEGVEPVEVMAERAGIPQEKIIRLNGNENPYGPRQPSRQPWPTSQTSTTTPTRSSASSARPSPAMLASTPTG